MHDATGAGCCSVYRDTVLASAQRVSQSIGIHGMPCSSLGCISMVYVHSFVFSGRKLHKLGSRRRSTTRRRRACPSRHPNHASSQPLVSAAADSPCVKHTCPRAGLDLPSSLSFFCHAKVETSPALIVLVSSPLYACPIDYSSPLGSCASCSQDSIVTRGKRLRATFWLAPRGH